MFAVEGWVIVKGDIKAKTEQRKPRKKMRIMGVYGGTFLLRIQIRLQLKIL